MPKKTPPEIRAFIEENVAGRRRSELTRMVNEKFGTAYTVGMIASCLKNWHLKSGMPTGWRKGERPPPVYKKEIADFILANYKGVGHAAMADMLNERFGTSFTKDQIKGYYARRHLDSGLTGRFEKGHEPANKGRKWEEYMSEEGQLHARAYQFPPGSLPHNTRPIGWERETKDGYIEVKVKMRPTGTSNDNFVLKHRLVWEFFHGPIPEGCNVIFIDGNKRNFEPDNLALITRAQNVILNKRGLRTTDPELFRTTLLLADVCLAKNTQKQKRKERRRKDAEGHSEGSGEAGARPKEPDEGQGV